MGLIWGLFSVIIASVAQLSLGFAASHLPPMTHLWDFIAALLAFGLDARILLLGLLGYLLSVFCRGQENQHQPAHNTGYSQ
ncbi:4-amino-4-deoxy-L-arabinose-phosphoundecaprenol flippase subunit ArnF, partial [Escherichia sp. R-CC3]